ncbi:unnamed protein product [Gadus morhua 'NCC']
MLVPVEYKGVSKWVRVPKVEEVFSFSEFLQGVLAKFNLSGFTALMLKDSAGVEVDSDIFDELLKSSQPHAFEERRSGVGTWFCQLTSSLPSTSSCLSLSSDALGSCSL